MWRFRTFRDTLDDSGQRDEIINAAIYGLTSIRLLRSNKFNNTDFCVLLSLSLFGGSVATTLPPTSYARNLTR